MSNTNYYYNNLPLPRSQSYSSNSIRSFSNSNNNLNKRSESISAISTLSSLSSASQSNRSATFMNQQQLYNNNGLMSPPPMPPLSVSGTSDYNRGPSSYYSTSDYDGARYQPYNQPLPETPSSVSPSDYYYVNNGKATATSPRLNAYNSRTMMSTPPINNSQLNGRDYGFDIRNTYVDELPAGGKVNPSTSTNTKVSTGSNNSGSLSSNKTGPIFPPTEDQRLKINTALLATEQSFKVIYAGDATFKPDKGLLSKTKRSHFVLTNNHLLIYKSAQKARSEINMFDQSSSLPTKAVDKDRIFLKLSSIYAVHAVVTAVYTFRIEYFHSQSNQTLYHILTVDSDKECKEWVQALRKAVWVHHPRIESISTTERYTVIDRLSKQGDNFVNSDHIKIYKVVFKEKRFKVGQDVAREVFLPVIMAIGKFSFYFLPITVLDDEYLKTVERDRFGLLSIQSIKYENNDDTVVIDVKQVSKNNRQLVFASTFCEEIVQYLHRAVDSIIPPAFQAVPLIHYNIPSVMKQAQIITYKIPMDPEDDITGRDDEEMQRFNTTLRAFTAALNLNKVRFNYTISGPPKAKVFTLLPPNEIGGTPATYQKYEILAIFRTLQVNNIFVEVSLANRPLDEMETWQIQAKHGWTANSLLKDENILSNEIYCLLISLKSLRKLDLTNCSIGKPSPDFPMRRHSALSTLGTVMRSGKTHLSRLSLGENKMSDSDLSKLIQGIREHKKSIKELYLNDCGLEKDMIESILKILYEKNPEQVIRLDLSVDIKHCVAIDPDLVQQMIPAFKRLETLRMRGYNLLSVNYNFNLESSHLHELDLGGSRMNGEIVTRLCKWILSPSFQTIEELHLGDCNLNGKHVYDILQSISQSGNRAMHLNLECNPIMKEVMHLPKLHSAILQGEGPKSLSLARIEWDDSTLREFIDCLRDNQTISHIDLSDISMKDTDEISEDTIRMLTSLFERNNHLTELELHYKFNKSPNSPFTKSQPKSLICDAIVQALNGLRHNVSLQHLNLSGLNFEDAGAMALSRVLKTNRSLQSIILDENNISIDGYRNLIKVIEETATQVINIPIPRNDLRFQLRYLAFRIEELIISENEAQFFLIHTTASDKKKAKKHELEMIIQERRSSELALKNLEGVIHALLAAVRKNARDFEEQNFRNMEFQLQAQNAAQELAIAQVRLQQQGSRSGSAMSNANLSAVGVPPKPSRILSSSNASTTSSTNSSVHNLNALSRSVSQMGNNNGQRRSMMSSDYSGSVMSSPAPYQTGYYQQGFAPDPRMYMSRSNNIEEEMVLGKPHSYEESHMMLQSPISPGGDNSNYNDNYYQHRPSVDYPESVYSGNYITQPQQPLPPVPNGDGPLHLDDPGFISDFGYVDDFEQSFSVDPNMFGTTTPTNNNGTISHRHQIQMMQQQRPGARDNGGMWSEEQLVNKFNHNVYLPPDARD